MNRKTAEVDVGLQTVQREIAALATELDDAEPDSDYVFV
jgi:hypothetical protein